MTFPIVRSALSTIAHVEVDERDAKQLELTDEGDAHTAPYTFQGCEAEIVILSTVRNQGQDELGTGESKGSIGFLKASADPCCESVWKTDPAHFALGVVSKSHKRRAFPSSGGTLYTGQRGCELF
jgi:hypothetical protein